MLVLYLGPVLVVTGLWKKRERRVERQGEKEKGRERLWGGWQPQCEGYILEWSVSWPGFSLCERSGRIKTIRILHYMWKLYEIQVSGPTHKVSLEHSLPLLCLRFVYGYFMTQQQNWVVEAEIMGPANYKVVTIYPFRERAHSALRRMGRMQKSITEKLTSRGRNSG